MFGLVTADLLPSTREVAGSNPAGVASAARSMTRERLELIPSAASSDQPDPSRDDPRLDLSIAPEHVECHCKTVGEWGLRSKAESLDSALRVTDRDPHLAAARRTAMYDEFGSAQLCDDLGESAHARRFAGADIEDERAGGRCSHRAPQRADRIADISEIPGLLTIAKNLDRFAAKQPVGENRNHPGIG